MGSYKPRTFGPDEAGAGGNGGVLCRIQLSCFRGYFLHLYESKSRAQARPLPTILAHISFQLLKPLQPGS